MLKCPHCLTQTHPSQNVIRDHCPHGKCGWKKCAVCHAVITRNSHYHPTDNRGQCTHVLTGEEK